MLGAASSSRLRQRWKRRQHRSRMRSGFDSAVAFSIRRFGFLSTTGRRRSAPLTRGGLIVVRRHRHRLPSKKSYNARWQWGGPIPRNGLHFEADGAQRLQHGGWFNKSKPVNLGVTSIQTPNSRKLVMVRVSSPVADSKSVSTNTAQSAPVANVRCGLPGRARSGVATSNSSTPPGTSAWYTLRNGSVRAASSFAESKT